MTTSSTYAFDPSFGEMALTAFARIGVRRTEITTQHLSDAALEANLVQVEISNLQPNLWTAELYPVTLTQGTATYPLPARMISPMAVYLTITQNGVSTDRIMTPISTYEYAALPDKTVQGVPNSFWYERTSAPQLNVWPVPDDNADYVIKLRILSQLQDAKLPNATTADIPYRWYDVFVAKLAHRLSRIYAPALEDRRLADAERAWQVASNEDYENTPMFVIPGLNGYYR